MSDRAVTIYCGLLLALGAFSIDITLPFFGVIRDAMDASDAATHAVITLYIFCLGIGQLMFGSFSDRYGRRPTLAAGLLLYLIGTVIALMSMRIEVLLLGRALQGLGGGAAPVTARAILRDRFSGKQLAKAMAFASGIFSIGPIAAPLIGVGLVAAGGTWRIVFIAMTVIAGAMLIALLRLPETLREKQANATSPVIMLRNLRTLWTHPQSRYFLLLSAWIMVSIVTIIAGMPRVMEAAYGITGTLFALLFAIHGIGIIAGQTANHWMIGRFGVVPSATVAACIMTATFAVMAVMDIAGWLNGYRLAGLVALFAVGYLIVYANSASMTMEPHGKIAGFTAAFFGFFGQGVSSILASIVLLFVGDSALRWTLALFAICGLSLIALLRWRPST